MNSALFQSLFCYHRSQSQDQEEEEEKEKDQEEEEGGGEGEGPGGEGEGPGGGGGGGGGGAVAAHISVFQMEMSTRHAFLYHAYGVVCVWIWHVIGQLCFDPSTRARGASPPNRACACIARWRWDPDVRVQCVGVRRGGRGPRALFSLAQWPPTPAL